MADKRKMEVQIVAKDKTKAGTQSAENNLDGVASAAAGVGVAAAGAAIALGSMVVAKSLTLWAAQEKAIIQVEKRLKSTGAQAWTSSKQLQAMASSFQNLTVFGDEAVLQMQSLLLTFKDIRGPIFERTTGAILDMASALAQSTGGEPDLRSAATMVGKALQDPVLGLTAMSRAGIQFSDAQKEVIKDLVETNQKAEAQTIILKELESQFGGAAGAEGLSAAVTQAENVFGDLFEKLGEGIATTSGLEDSLRGLTNYMGDSATRRNIKLFGEALGEIPSELGKTLAILAAGPLGPIAQLLMARAVTPGAEPAPIPELEAALAAFDLQGPGGVEAGAGGIPIAPSLTAGLTGIGGVVSGGEGGEGVNARLEFDRILLAESLELERQAADMRVDLAADTESRIQGLKRTTLNVATDLLMQFLGNSKEAALAGIALQTGFALTENFMMTKAASARALAELGPIFGPPAVVGIEASGATNAALIAAAGVVRGVGAAVTFGGSPSVDAQEQIQATQPLFKNGGEKIVRNTYHIYGNVVDHDQFARELVEPIARAQADGVTA
jgi:hypothetical protein